jgi:hypothetical protein
MSYLMTLVRRTSHLMRVRCCSCVEWVSVAIPQEIALDGHGCDLLTFSFTHGALCQYTDDERAHNFESFP